MKRVKKVYSDPNPLFMQWLKELREEAVKKEQPGLVKIYNMCIESLGRYPLPLETARQCGALTGFGATICRQLDLRLQQHQARGGQGRELVCPLSPVPPPPSTPVPQPPASPLRQIQNVCVEGLQKEVTVAAPSPPKKSRVFDATINDLDDRVPGLSNKADQSQEDEDLELALVLSQAEVDVTQEDRDLEMALSLSQAAFAPSPGYNNNPSRENRDSAQMTQEEKDQEFARRLQLELDQEEAGGGEYQASQQQEDDEELARRLHMNLNKETRELSDNETELPDLESGLPDLDPLGAPHVSEDMRTVGAIVRDSEIKIPGGQYQSSHREDNSSKIDRHPPGQDHNNTSKKGGTSFDSSSTSSKNRKPVKAKKVLIHNISVRSDDGDQVEASTALTVENQSNPLDSIFGSDPVLNLEKRNKGKGRGAAKGVGKEATPRVPTSTEAISSKSPRKRKSGDTSRLGTPGSTRKEYVPKTRSGAYAVLLTLYSEALKDSYQGYMSKAELQRLAQPLADDSFVLANVRTEFQYSAWSGVTTLLKHELVKKWSNPAKFDITEKGRILAARLEAAEAGPVVGGSGLGQDEDTDGLTTRLSAVNSTVAGDPVVNRRQNKPARGKAQNTDTKRKKRESGTGEARSGPKTAPSASNIALEDDPELAIALQASRQDTGDQFDLGNSIDWDQSFGEIPSQAGTSSSNVKSVGCSSSDVPLPSSRLESDVALPLPLALQQMFKKQITATGSLVDTHKPEVVLAPGTFDILLCVDNTETKGGGSGGRQSLKTETVRHLAACRVEYDQRNLNIGDFLWIARERVSVVDGQFIQRQPRELVLPYVVERKRLDDLWASVKDGRYEEQKFRMKSCGLGHLFYLIEDHPKSHQFWGKAGGGGMLVTPEAIEQAIANTAVQEGFTVKKTADQKGTIEYLTLFTRLLSKKYSGLRLSSCTQSDLSEGLVAKRDTTLMQFKEFNDASKKSKKLQLNEVFAKTLLRLKGLSADMAQAIVQQYPTPCSLMSAYQKAGSEAAKLKVIQDISYGLEAKRKIPKAVAEALLKFWTNPSLG